VSFCSPQLLRPSHLAPVRPPRLPPPLPFSLDQAIRPDSLLPSSSTSLLPGPSVHGQISQPDIKPQSYDHQVTPLLCSLELNKLRSTTRLPLSWADFHTPFPTVDLHFSSTFPQLQLPGPLHLLLSRLTSFDTHWTPPPPQAYSTSSLDVSCTTSCPLNRRMR
jgi:hypothetical protein